MSMILRVLSGERTSSPVLTPHPPSPCGLRRASPSPRPVEGVEGRGSLRRRTLTVQSGILSTIGLSLLLFTRNQQAAVLPAEATQKGPEVKPILMLSGALVADNFDKPPLNTQVWQRPDWLVKNDTNLSVRVENGHLHIGGVSRPVGRHHQYTGVLSTYFRETDVVLSARLRVTTPFDKPGRIRHQVHLCTGDWPDFFTEINFGKIDGGSPRWFSGYLDKIWEYAGYDKYLEGTLPATGTEATDWHQVLIVHDGTTHATQNYLIQGGTWTPVGPAHQIKMNHSHVELKVDVAVPDVRVEMDFDDVRLYPGPARHPVTIVVDSPLNRTRTRPAYRIDELKVRLIESGSRKVLGEGKTDEGGQAQVTLKSDVVYPVAARIEVENNERMLMTATIPQESVRGLYPADVWVVSLPAGKRE